MISAESMPACKNALIGAAIRDLINDGSRTFLSKDVAQVARSYGLPVSSRDVGSFFSSHPEKYKKMKMTRSSWRWQLVEDVE